MNVLPRSNERERGLFRGIPRTPTGHPRATKRHHEIPLYSPLNCCAPFRGTAKRDETLEREREREKYLFLSGWLVIFDWKDRLLVPGVRMRFPASFHSFFFALGRFNPGILFFFPLLSPLPLSHALVSIVLPSLSSLSLTSFLFFSSSKERSNFCFDVLIKRFERFKK